MSWQDDPRRKAYKIDPRSKNNDPEAALLTEGLRNFVTGDHSGYAASTQSGYWDKINRRVWNTYLDFSLLVEELPEKRRSKILETDEYLEEIENTSERTETIHDVYDALSDTIAFLFLLLEDENSGVYSWPHRQTFRTILEPAVENAVVEIEGADPIFTSVDVDFDVDVDNVEPTDIDRMIDKIAEGEVNELSGTEVRSLIQIVDNNESFPEKRTFGVGGWEDLAEQIAERRQERDDIVTREDWKELAELPDEEVKKRIKEKRAKYEKYKESNDDE